MIDNLVEEHCDQKMLEDLNESLRDLDEGLLEPSNLLAILPLGKEGRNSTFIQWGGDTRASVPIIYTWKNKLSQFINPEKVEPSHAKVVRAEVLKLLQAGIIYPILDSPWVGGCVLIIEIECVTKKDHFPLPFIDQVLERVSGHPFYCFLDGHSGYFQIEIDVEDWEKTTFTCPFETYAYRRMS
ncbi:hypothetical protein CK203_056483 [Vitis vinifera]|uniref:Transposon Ty3-I Gag-Pol polyprotein n=1 Tax=Vitis vinifera TaxID=29760 RepID=A0A438GTP6_VITVI|nr:hypothetical protein CK203_056483 [Vitis vinifera]